MIKVVVSELGETPEEAIERHVSIVQMELPAVAELAPDDVVIEVKSASVGWVDLIMTSGQYQHLPEPPYTPGLEYAGVVREVGPAVTRAIAPGDRVLVDGLLAGPRSLGAHRKWGGWASFAVAPEAAVIPIPAPLDFDQACNLLGNYETAYHALVARGNLQRGQTLLVLGASGATGLAAVQVGKAIGATVLGVGRSAKKLEIVRALGADATIELGEGVSLRDEVRAKTGGQGVDAVYDPVGGALSVESMRCVKFGAKHLVVGWAATPFVARGKGARGAPNANQLPTNLIMMKGLDVLGCPAAISILHDPTLRPPRLAAVLAWAEQGSITPHVSHRYPLASIREAMLAKWRGDVVGGCVVHP